MPGRRKAEAQTAVALEEPNLIEDIGIESANKEEVDHHVKQLVDSATLPQIPETPTLPETPTVIDEAHLKELMARMLHAREQTQQARERVREINGEVSDRSEGMAGKIKEKYQKAVEELSASKRLLNLTRAELMVALRSWNKPYRMSY